MPRPRKPNNVHVLQGTYRRDKHGPKTAPVPQEAPEKPDWLSAQAASEWDRVVPLLNAAGFLAVTDGDVLATYCELYAEFKMCPQAMQTSRVALMRTILHELGMTPGSRDKVSQAQSKSDNPFGAL